MILRSRIWSLCLFLAALTLLEASGLPVFADDQSKQEISNTIAAEEASKEKSKPEGAKEESSTANEQSSKEQNSNAEEKNSLSPTSKNVGGEQSGEPNLKDRSSTSAATPGESVEKTKSSKGLSAATEAKLPISLDTVRKSYTARNYREALEILAKLKPDEQTHYYTAMCYQALGKLKQAAVEFQWVATNGKDATLIKYSKNALAGLARVLNVRGPGISPQVSNPATPAVTIKPPVYQGNNPIKREQRTTDSSEVMINRRGHFR